MRDIKVGTLYIVIISFYMTSYLTFNTSFYTSASSNSALAMFNFSFTKNKYLVCSTFANGKSI